MKNFDIGKIGSPANILKQKKVKNLGHLRLQVRRDKLNTCTMLENCSRSLIAIKGGSFLREVHFCKTCDFRLPFCVRTDRAFCGTRCRVWWYRHPGHKRLDFSPGDEIPARQKHGQPKTLAEALVLLEAERTRAAKLEDAAKRAQTQEGILRNQLEDEVEDERGRTEDVRYDLTQEIKQLRRELDEQRPSKERVSAEQEELNRQFEELRLRFEENAQSLMRRDGELTKQRQDFAASERAHREIHATADSIVRSLAEEKNRRIAAERHVEELRQELRRIIMTPPALLSEAQRLALLDLHSNMISIHQC